MKTVVLSTTLVLVLVVWTAAVEWIIDGNRVTTASLALELAGVIVLALVGATIGVRWANERGAALAEAAEGRELLRTSYDRLDEASQFLRAIVDTSPVATIGIDRDRRITFWSAGAETLLGWSAEEVIGRPLPQEVDDGGPEPDGGARRLRATGPVLGERTKWRTKDGQERIVEIYAAPLMRDGAIDGFAGQAVDITDREQARVKLERLGEAIEQMADGVVITDEAGVIVYVNRAFAEESGRAAADLIGSHHSSLVGELLGPEVQASMEQVARSGEPWFGEVEQRHADGSPSMVQLSFTPLRDTSGVIDGMVALQRDVTYIRAIEGDLALEAGVRGVLAGAAHLIPPQAGLQEAAGAVCDALRSIAGIDFAAVAVFFGPSEVSLVGLSAPGVLSIGPGDLLAPSFSSQLYEQMLNGPWGQRLVFGPDASRFAAELDQLGLKAFAFAPIVHGDHIDGAVGIGTSDPAFAATLADRFPRLVDFSTAPTALLAERLHGYRGEVALRKAIAEMIASRAFHPVFQPIVELASGAVVGYEALTRFDRGQEPDLAFANARAVGLGVELEVATLRAAIEASCRLPAGSWLSVNVSPPLLSHVEMLKSCLAGANRQVVIEVTEHEPVADYGALREAMRSLGPDVRLAVDDAGAGIANFAHILEMDANLVKLDTSLVRGINTSPARQALVVAMNHFARTVGCRLVAEGIESEAEALTLREFGVEFGQGYWFGRPEPLPFLVGASGAG
jgi:PAS domain S-box-containing protein